MKKAIWLTDLHVNHLKDTDFVKLCLDVAKKKPDLVLIGGDTTDGKDLYKYLSFIAKQVGCPTYYVLGNHDCYHSTIKDTLASTVTAQKASNLHYLPYAAPVALDEGAVLIGTGGWGDAGCGFLEGAVSIADKTYIGEFKGIPKWSPTYFQMLGEVGKLEAKVLEAQLKKLKKAPHTLVVLSHVSPFPWASMYDGKLSTPEWQPHFVWSAGGKVLSKYAKDNPTTRIVCLTGHNHNIGGKVSQGNIHALCGNGSDYGSPKITVLDSDKDYLDGH